MKVSGFREVWASTNKVIRIIKGFKDLRGCCQRRSPTIWTLFIEIWSRQHIKKTRGIFSSRIRISSRSSPGIWGQKKEKSNRDFSKSWKKKRPVKRQKPKTLKPTYSVNKHSRRKNPPLAKTTLSFLLNTLNKTTNKIIKSISLRQATKININKAIKTCKSFKKMTTLSKRSKHTLRKLSNFSVLRMTESNQTTGHRTLAPTQT